MVIILVAVLVVVLLSERASYSAVPLLFLHLRGTSFKVVGRALLLLDPKQKIWVITSRQLALFFVFLDIG
jgi:hypothetical protein